MRTDNPWLRWAKELQFLSQCALAYCKDGYDIERFQRIREISAEMMARLLERPVEAVRDVFLCEKGYQTPKIECRAAAIRDGRILLTQENNGKWVLPGGWVDAGQTVASNAVKETLEEAGWQVRPIRLIALLDRNRHNRPRVVQDILSAYVLCEPISGHFVPNAETLDSRFFSPDALPELSENKTTEEQIRMCFDAWRDDRWQPLLE